MVTLFDGAHAAKFWGQVLNYHFSPTRREGKSGETATPSKELLIQDLTLNASFAEAEHVVTLYYGAEAA